MRERGRGEVFILLPVQLTTSRIGNLTRLILILAICVTIHTYKETQDTTTAQWSITELAIGGINKRENTGFLNTYHTMQNTETYPSILLVTTVY